MQSSTLLYTSNSYDYRAASTSPNTVKTKDAQTQTVSGEFYPAQLSLLDSKLLESYQNLFRILEEQNKVIKEIQNIYNQQKKLADDENVFSNWVETDNSKENIALNALKTESLVEQEKHFRYISERFERIYFNIIGLNFRLDFCMQRQLDLAVKEILLRSLITQLEKSKTELLIDQTVVSQA